MGSLLHIFYFNQGRMAKKVHANKRHNRGLKSPWNSAEMHVETSQVHFSDEEPHYSSQDEDGWSKDNSYSCILKNEELSKQSTTRKSTPSIVARLMGIDMMPLDTKTSFPSHERISENNEKKISKKVMNGRGSSIYNNSSSQKKEFDSSYQHIDDNNDIDGWEQNFGKPRPREHPQEKELQKFKKEFEAYQAARFKECSSKFVEIETVSSPILAQENLNNEKVSHNLSSQKEASDLDSHSFNIKLRKMNPISTKKNESFPSRRRSFEESSMMKCASTLLDTCSSPTHVVILKPCPDKIFDSSSNTLHGRNSIENLLEEVRERLKCELQGKTVKKCSAVVRASGIETPYGEKSPDPTGITHRVAKGVRENVTRDAKANSLRSALTRSHNSDIHFNGSSSPEEFFNNDTRRFLSERLRNTVNSEEHANGMNNRESLKEEIEIHRGSFRYEPDGYKFDISPRNLVRSLSAPVSGTSFGKILLDDCHILSGAQVHRNLEAVEAIPLDVKKQKKHRFNIKEKVSNFKHNLGLRGKLFRKRVQSVVEESNGHENDAMVRDIRSGPTVLLKYGDGHENSTEVPPSPASVCSYAQEEYWSQIEYLSPISTPNVSSIDDIRPKVFRDISSGLNELRRQLSEFGSDCPENFTMKQKHVESELVQLDDPAESYIRDLLIASGLYFGTWDKYLLRGDTLAKPISNSVFEQVEESHKKLSQQNERSKLDHKVLLDLLNEALSIVLGPPLSLSSRFRKKLRNFSMQPLPCGKELLKLVWEIVSVPLCSSPLTLENLVAQEFGSISWFELINDQINVFGREITFLITDDLVEEFTKDMLLGEAM